MKILHVIAINNIGGAEKLLVTLLPELKAHGANIDCLLFYRKPYNKNATFIGEQLRENGISVSYQEYDNVASRENFRFLEVFIKRCQPSIVHAHLRHAELWLSILKWLGRIDVLVVATLHGYRDEYQNKYGLNWNAKARCSWYFWLTRFVCKQIDYFIGISKGIAELFIKSELVAANKVEVIYHGAHAGKVNFVKEKALSPDLAIIGRLIKCKGHAYAIDAMVFLKEKFPSITLHIYGIGEEEENLKQQVARLALTDHVCFHGFVSDLSARLAKHSVIVVPSFGEAFGLVFFDAFEAGLPVVTFDIAANNEIILHRENGLLAKPFSSESLAQEIAMLLEDGELYHSIASNAQQILVEKYSMRRMALDYLSFYERKRHQENKHELPIQTTIAKN